MSAIVRNLWSRVKAILPTERVGAILPDRLRTQWRIRLSNFHEHPPILVYTMGKVGTTTLTRSLAAMRLPNRVYHVHFLTPAGIANEKADYAARNLLKTKRAEHVMRSEALLRRLNRGSFRSLIVTGVRDPVGRRVSEVFQKADWYYTDLLDAHGQVDVERTVEFLRNEFDRTQPGDVFSWFHRELHPTFGIDVFDRPFDRARGYTIIEGEQARVLLFCLESLNDQFDQAITEFMGIDEPVRVVNRNRSAQKPYHDRYQEVKAALELSEETVNRIYDSPAVRHFYPEALVDTFKARWLHRVPSPSEK